RHDLPGREPGGDEPQAREAPPDAREQRRRRRRRKDHRRVQDRRRQPHRRRFGGRPRGAAELRCGGRARPGNISRRSARGRGDRPEPDGPPGPREQGDRAARRADPRAGGRARDVAQDHGGGAPVTPKDVLSLKEASTYLAMDETTLARLATERRIPSLQLEGRWVFSKKSIDKWRSQQQRPTRSRARPPGRSSPSSPSATAAASTLALPS